MANPDDLSKYLPLSETTFYTMLCLAEEPMHGYALMQKVGEISRGTVTLGAGTLYTIFSTLEREALIKMVSESERRKTYALTARGQQVLRLQIQRLEIMAEHGRRIKALLTN
ncbi:MAG: PadR family transcriptional regulator [Anaerolineae bacterium]|nr:MAG: PadR family transcriptional regulator [Anaerolineae bacterium]